MNHQPNIIKTTADWFVKAGQQPAVAEPDPKQVCFYTGLQIEELTEKLGRILGAELVQPLVEMANDFKRCPPELLMRCAVAMKDAPDKLLDDDMDLIWVSIGAARATGADVEQAYGLVGEANWAKFPGGIVTRDVNGKVMKPAGWKEADLNPAVHPILKGEQA